MAFFFSFMGRKLKRKPKLSVDKIPKTLLMFKFSKKATNFEKHLPFLTFLSNCQNTWEIFLISCTYLSRYLIYLE